MKNIWKYLIIILIFSCGKYKTETLFAYKTIKLPKEITVRNTLFLSKLVGFSVGGSRTEFGELYKTMDGGNSWKLKKEVKGANLYTVYFMDTLNGVAGGEAMHYYFTKDGGETWSRKFMWPNLPKHQKDISDFKRVVQYNDTTLLFVCGDNYNEGVFFRINTDHENWTFEEKKHELKGITTYNGFVFVSGYGYVGKYNFETDSVYQKKKSGDFYVAIHAFSEKELLMAGNEGKFYQSKDGGENWKIIARKSRQSKKRWMLNDMLFINSNEGVAIGNYGLILYTANKGEDWKEYRLPDKEMLYSISAEKKTLYVSAEKGKIIQIELEDLRY